MDVIKITIPPARNRDGELVASQYTGYRAGLNFANGSAYSEEPLNAGQRAYLARKGYIVEGDDAGHGEPLSDDVEGATSKRTGGRKGGTGKGETDA